MRTRGPCEFDSRPLFPGMDGASSAAGARGSHLSRARRGERIVPPLPRRCRRDRRGGPSLWSGKFRKAPRARLPPLGASQMAYATPLLAPSWITHSRRFSGGARARFTRLRRPSGVFASRASPGSDPALWSLRPHGAAQSGGRMRPGGAVLATSSDATPASGAGHVVRQVNRQARPGDSEYGEGPARP